MARFRMQKIEVEQFDIMLDVQPVAPMSLNTTLGFSVIKEIRTVIVELMITYVSDGQVGVLLKLLCYFEVHPEDWKAMAGNEKITLPKAFLAHIAMHTFGTARGILYCKTERTPFQNYILPPTNVEEMVKGDLEIE